MERSSPATAALTALSVLAMVAVCALARPSAAEARADLLAGSPRISTVRAFVPERGRDAGRMVVWVRVGHAPGTRRGLARERPETVHTGRVVVRVGDASGFATEQLDLDGRRLLRGYHLRFPRGAARAAQGGSADRVRVSVRAAQRVDLDSDGDAEDRALASTTRRVSLARRATSIEPPDGRYQSTPGDWLDVAGGHVVGYFFLSGTASPCGVGPAGRVSAPIDPQTGLFSFANTGRWSNPPVTTTAQGDFRDNTSLVLLANISRAGCTYRVQPSSFSFLSGL